MAHLAGTSTDLRHNDIGVEYENEFDKLRWGFRYGEVRWGEFSKLCTF